MSKPNEGLPPLNPGPECVSRFEFMHPVLFYLPIAFYALWLMLKYRSIMLPTLANPRIFAGGAVGERKSDVFDLAGPYARAHIAPYMVEAKTEDTQKGRDLEQRLKEAGLSYPLVAKPETGLRGAGVRPILSRADLDAYLEDFPVGQAIMLQEKVEYTAEAGVFYIRHPRAQSGSVFSLTLKYASTVCGDGRSTLKDLILACPRCRRMQDIYFARHHDMLERVLEDGEEMAINFAGNHARGAIFRDGAAHITPEMTQAFDAVAKDFPDLHFARFDVRFNSLEALKKGGDFKILEVNGVGAEATHIWDCQMGHVAAYKVLASQWRQAFEIGAANRARQHTLPSARVIAKVWLKELMSADDYPLAH